MRAAVVINPSKPAAQDIRGVIARLASEFGWDEPLWQETTAEDPGVGQARDALEAGVDVVIAAGGDGTVRCVGEVLAGTETPLGLVPLGTGNLLARNLGVDVTDIEGAAKAALLGEARRIDVVRSVRDGGSEQVFLVMAGLGFDASIMADTDSDLKDKVGWLAYVDAAMRNLQGKPVKAKVSVDGKPVASRRVRSVMVGNCGRIQGGVEIFPGAAVDDGILDLMVVAPGKLGWLGVLAGVIGRGRSKDPSVEYFRGTSVDVILERADDFQLDGDHEGKASTFTARVDPGALLVRV
ncbi:diacylglycerol/lipid kinase family protein [Arthrobacter celericrescens]|uniref:diacylglycerol/lipid kinase family protein n=1 Tax=Arthrobacter celericrescens TaxID=2320851 RepID=UPI000EA166E5|nr:diacylglycerol kinase family protein [Arthrobacter celericrescens]